MEPTVHASLTYPSRDVRLSEPNSVRWDGGNADERRRLIAEVTDTLLREQTNLGECAIRMHHADGRLLAKTVLHKPLFVNAP